MNPVLQILQIATSKGLMVATAESCTGGMVAARLTDVPGSSAVMERGFVTYTNRAKTEMLGVSGSTLATHGAVSEHVAAEMAAGALNNSAAQIAIAITGIAGPGGSEFKPEGRVCFGLSSADSTTSHTVEFGALGRKQVREAACAHALSMLLDAVRSAP